jgi:hypothetical protein
MRLERWHGDRTLDRAMGMGVYMPIPTISVFTGRAVPN